MLGPFCEALQRPRNLTLDQTLSWDTLQTVLDSTGNILLLEPVLHCSRAILGIRRYGRHITWFKGSGEHISAIDDGQHGIHQLAIVDAALEGSR